VGKHVIKEEIDLLKEKIDELIYNGYRKEIFVITPFTSVKSYCNDVFESQKKIVKCGTIHTFQGREAEIVFLVLGSDPTKDKARRWVTESPNMINVALTRAKRRFFMIGNKKHWGHLPFIRQFEGLLPVVENINP
jgi:superfamily I DNA and/or RNA helicase